MKKVRVLVCNRFFTFVKTISRGPVSSLEVKDEFWNRKSVSFFILCGLTSWWWVYWVFNFLRIWVKVRDDFHNIIKIPLKILGSVALGCYQKISVGPLELLLLQVLGLAESRSVDNVSKWLQSRCMESRFLERTHYMNFSCSLWLVAQTPRLGVDITTVRGVLTM